MHLPTSMASLNEVVAKLPQKKIAKTLSILILGYIAYLCAQITWLIIAPSAQHTFYPVTVSSGQQENTVKPLSVSELLKLNLFGLYTEKEKAQVAEQQVTNAPETKLRLTLSATVASDEASIAAAIIESSGKQETYGIGDTIIGTRAILEQVLTDRIIIKQSGRFETLMLDGFDYEAISVSQSRPIAAQQANRYGPVSNVPAKNNRAKTTNKIVDQRENSALRAQATQLKNDINKDPGKITDYLKISPKRNNGTVIGYQLMPGKNPEFFKQSGLKAGDVAVQMNGFDLIEPREAAQALAALKQEQEVSLLILRNNELTEVLFSIDN